MDDLLISGLEEAIPEEAISIYPNPFSDYLSLEIHAGNFRPTKLQLRNIEGKVIYTREIRSTERKFVINDITAGYYLVEIISQKGQIWRQKLLKMGD